MKPLLLNSIQKITGILETVSPALSRWWVQRLFFSPRTTRRMAPDIAELQQQWLQFENIEGDAQQCRVYTAGDGPAVLLVHGWEGSAWSLSALGSALVAQGFRVILFDMPAHGLSPGSKTNLVEVSRIIHKLAAEAGGLKAVIGHSFGTVAAGYAISKRLSAEQFICISPPSSIDFIIDRFCSIIAASDRSRSALVHRIETILDDSYQQASLNEMDAVFKLDGLIIHDRKDRMVPYGQATALSAAWPAAALMTTCGLGHNRILRNSDVIDRIVGDLQEDVMATGTAA